MAHINKLAIRGIRSFDDKNIAVMEFFSPVTVIVGHNGSGKTTIIECLKYATTGDQPPNTRGGAFVHDPKMANEKEVKAQVKLRFYAANGQRMLAVRNLSVTMKKNGALTMKTLESILGLAENMEKGNGKRGVISTKCAEMDTEIPHLLGVSKAVLENVIFCHQEDSYWPLAEPAALKKKFDDIFEATKYTKALDNIKALRKDRVADLKADQERLESLSREKAHADKLKARIKEQNELIAAKSTEYDDVRAAYDQQVRSNQILNDTGSKFREIYVKADQLSQRRAQYQEELNLARENLQEISGMRLSWSVVGRTDEELSERLRTHDDYILNQRQKWKAQDAQLQDAEDQIKQTRAEHVELMGRQGKLLAEEQAAQQRTDERDALVRELATRYHIKGFEQSPLDREQASQFLSALNDVKRRQHNETDRLQVTLQKKIGDAELDVDAARVLTSRLAELKADIEEKRRRLDRARQEINSAGFDKKILEKTQVGIALEQQRDALNLELRTLSLQADTRAKLDLQRGQMKAKESEIKMTIEVCSNKFRRLVGVDARPETMERELDRAAHEKEREQGDLEARSSVANQELQAAVTSLNSLQAQMDAKREEIKSMPSFDCSLSDLDKRIQVGLEDGEFKEVQEAIAAARVEISVRNEDLGKNAGTHDVYKTFLEEGKKKKCCPLCTRDFNDKEFATFEKKVWPQEVQETMKKSTPEAIKEVQSELQDWEAELKRLQDLSVTRELKEIIDMRQHAVSVSKAHKDIERLKQDIKDLEDSLKGSSGSTKTADDVQQELQQLSDELRANEREKQSLLVDRDAKNNAVRTHETELHRLELEESECRNKLRDKDELERRIEEMKAEIVAANTRLKDLDSLIADAQAPMEKLEREHKELERELNAKISQAQKASQDLNMSADKLETMNKWLAKNGKEKIARRLKELNAEIKEKEDEVQKQGMKLEEIRAKLSQIDKEINEAGVTMANLRDNLRFRRLKRDLAATDAELNAIDMEEAAKAKRIWTDKWTVEKQKENDLQSRYSHIAGELSSLQTYLKTLESDMSEFKNVGKKYRDQLIKVKMSDMANNDLEKYAKALDNAIMKYHSLKMEEVNDTMRHLWNKTYQGTDIDGIKISSDSEGGATKRSYNYRVVMTKDQVEMDMRGRCSAGQKMLASIIIRLALADSFGQNCGILALDEPTNALDTENIDALAASLVDIINERRNHANFQLIIITHDENFLRKLGQNDVMEYYWRVSRDSRQKSIIERHRFG
ncbi:hypothetical protein OH76DRAFT_1362729 [Lentinus brumalis]|uniref:DNA repair protein RAD50 n=1 Tax=Lentinus brumalis TaxID=2498619 RepID=A0A371CQI2_9APHY|nr:hypothetical protein OH76DRAFT_1362729 [Polyporus brumalis]